MSNVAEYNLSNLPTADVMKGWSRDEVKEFLQRNRADLELEENDIDVIYGQNVTGKAFLRLKEEQLTRDPGPFKLLFGPASAIADVVKQINGEQPSATGKRKTEDSSEELDSKKVKQIVPTTPESIAEFLEGQEGVKDDFTKPHQLCENEFNFQRKGRDKTLSGIYDCIVERYYRIKKALDNERSFGGKTYHRVLAIQATPGGGKSFLLDELAALKNEDFENYLKNKEYHCPIIVEDEWQRRYNEAVNNAINTLRDSVAVCITYNGHSSYDYNRFVDHDVERGLVMRILWSYFFDDKKLIWQNFCKKFSTNFESLDIHTAVQSILYHSKKRVLLCVDESMKILSGIEATDTNQKQARVNKFLNHLYNPYQAFAKDKEELIKFNFILTTLDAVYVQTNTTDSGREIEWIPLRRLEISESAELFNEIITSLNLDEHRLFLIKKCIADCNGHPRTLEKLYRIFNNNKEAREIHNCSSLIAILTKDVGEWYKNITFPVVKTALLGETVRLSHIINTNGEQLSVSALISSGAYINSLTENIEAEFVVPTLSPISLQYFCLNSKVDGDAKIATKIIQSLLTAESSFDDEVMDGKPFERFHANWELLYRVLRENGKKIRLHEIYGLDEGGIEIQLQRKRIANCHKEIEFPPSDTIYNSSGEIFENLIDYLFVPKKSNNSGFVMVIFERKADESGYIAINIECRFTYRDNQTTLESDEILDKYINTRSKYLMHVRYLRNRLRSETDAWEEGSFYDKSSVGKLKMTENDIYLVFVVWRNLGTLSSEVLNNKNIIIVERENLKKIYTPSLVSRPQFYSHIFEKINNIRFEDQ